MPVPWTGRTRRPSTRFGLGAPAVSCSMPRRPAGATWWATLWLRLTWSLTTSPGVAWPIWPLGPRRCLPRRSRTGALRHTVCRIRRSSMTAIDVLPPSMTCMLWRTQMALGLSSSGGRAWASEAAWACREFWWLSAPGSACLLAACAPGQRRPAPAPRRDGPATRPGWQDPAAPGLAWAGRGRLPEQGMWCPALPAPLAPRRGGAPWAGLSVWGWVAVVVPGAGCLARRGAPRHAGPW